MTRQKVIDNAIGWIGKTNQERIDKAKLDGNTAGLIFSTTDTTVMPDILTAIDTEDKMMFAQACYRAGIDNSENMIDRMWDATMGSLDPQSAKPCW